MRRSTFATLASVLCAALPTAASAQHEQTILVGLHAGSPTKASIALGTGKSVATGRLFFFTVEPGIAGGRLRVGLAEMGPTSFLVTATALRTWGDPVGAVKDRNYLGPELQLMGKYGLGIRGGVLLPLGGASHPATSLGVSLGF